MVLALAVLLMQPLAAPAAAVQPLPIQSTHFSSAILTPVQAAAPATVANDKTAASDKTVTDDKDAKASSDAKTNADVKSNVDVKPNNDAQGNTQNDASKQAPANAKVDPNEGLFSTSASYMPGQLELTRVPSSQDDSSLESSSIAPIGAGGGAAVILATMGHKPAELAGRSGMPKMWFVLGAAEHGAATFDAWSTRRNISEGLVETNPMLKPFANSGGLYAAVQVAPVAFDFLSKAMLHSSHPWVRHMWWVPQTGSTVASVLSGAHNMAIH